MPITTAAATLGAGIASAAAGVFNGISNLISGRKNYARQQAAYEDEKELLQGNREFEYEKYLYGLGLLGADAFTTDYKSDEGTKNKIKIIVLIAIVGLLGTVFYFSVRGTKGVITKP